MPVSFFQNHNVTWFTFIRSQSVQHTYRTAGLYSVFCENQRPGSL